MKKAVVNKKFDQVFSISMQNVPLNEPMSFDLYTNFSGDGSSNKFMKVFPIGEVFEVDDLNEIQEKYGRLYVLEEQRHLFLSGLISGNDISEEKKSEIIKSSAIEYLDQLFEPNKKFSTELLTQSVKKCQDAVAVMVDLVQDYSIDALQAHIARLSFHDFYTYDHSVNVAMYCIAFQRFLKPDSSQEELSLAGLGGMLHDIGKIQISTSIINKPEKLSPQEFAEIQRHPWFGKELLCEVDFEAPKGVDLDVLKRVVFEHHESFDGSGYPEGLKGEEIHRMARLTAICDFFDAITTKRAYNTVVSIPDALAIMSKAAGVKIDPNLFKSFCMHCGGKEPSSDSVSVLASDFDPCQPTKGLPLKGYRQS
ncbi:HD domain-containing protein [bacterium]|nr:HD domain-containing protein [bacterium]